MALNSITNDDLFIPILKTYSQNGETQLSDLKVIVHEKYYKDISLTKTIKSGAPRIYDRISRCSYRLNAGKFIEKTSRGKYKITKKGEERLKSGKKITEHYLHNNDIDFINSSFNSGNKKNTKVKKNKIYIHSNTKDKNIPTPSNKEVKKYLEKRENLEDYVNQEKSLNKLFIDLIPENKKIEDILLKCSTLNDFYSTNIFKIYPVAKHILKLDIDNRLCKGDTNLVNDIAKIEIKGKYKNFYSFASKYCSHHKSKVFPIYDSYVEKILIYFQKKDTFSNFNEEDLKDYTIFKNILNDFLKKYKISYGLKELDRYLRQLGKEYFPKQKKQKKAQQ